MFIILISPTVTKWLKNVYLGLRLLQTIKEHFLLQRFDNIRCNNQTSKSVQFVGRIKKGQSSERVTECKVLVRS